MCDGNLAISSVPHWNIRPPAKWPNLLYTQTSVHEHLCMCLAGCYVCYLWRFSGDGPWVGMFRGPNHAIILSWYVFNKVSAIIVFLCVSYRSMCFLVIFWHFVLILAFFFVSAYFLTFRADSCGFGGFPPIFLYFVSILTDLHVFVCVLWNMQYFFSFLRILGSFL